VADSVARLLGFDRMSDCRLSGHDAPERIHVALRERRAVGVPAGFLRGLRGVGELAEQTGDHEHRLLGDANRVVPDPLEAACDEDHEHRPFAQLEVVADLDRPPEDLPVQPIDLGVLANQILRELDVALGERLLGLRDLWLRGPVGWRSMGSPAAAESVELS
jgi:hypothetical protein